ncbi:MAG: hypothetical protein HYZ10_10300 [Ignavibacteriales bacterium]|nr:hypothetical protein [Ignavibacteriales bacterium]
MLIDNLSLIFSGITTLAALYLSYVALKHSARPSIKIHMTCDQPIYCNEETNFLFELENVGHWYAKPMVVNLIIYFNFDNQFTLNFLKFGSTQELLNKNVKTGVGNMKYLKASGIKLSYGEQREKALVNVIPPSTPGKYKIKLSSYSENGVSYRRDIAIIVRAK